MADGEAAPAEVIPGVPRRIIYNGSVMVVVEDFVAAQEQLDKLVKEASGYIAAYQDQRSAGERLAGQWIARVPVDRFEAFLDSVCALGVAEQRQVNGQDVTEEFVDLEARLGGKRKLEGRILELLETRTAPLADVLEIETQLARVREEIERLEGRQRFLQNQTELATLTIQVREEGRYEPPRTPGFGERIAGTWAGSLESLRGACESAVLAAVAIAPWSVAFVALCVPPVAWWRRRRAARARD